MSPVESSRSDSTICLGPSVPVADGVNDVFEDIRKQIEGELSKLIYNREQDLEGVTFSCFFSRNGCKKKFVTRASVLNHARQCFYGVLQYCKQAGCNSNGENIFLEVKHFSGHVKSHQAKDLIINGHVGKDIKVLLEPDLLTPPTQGYNVAVLKRFEFVFNGNAMCLLLCLVVQNISKNYSRVMFAPLVYQPDGEKVFHLIDVECTVRGSEQRVVMPKAYPGFDERNVSGTTTTYGFPSAMAFIKASNSLDEVLTYVSSDLEALAFPPSHPEEKASFVLLDIIIKPYSCVVKKQSGFPHVPFALSWSDLDLDPQVRAMMPEGKLARPSEISRILIPQMKGTVDVMVECMDAKGVTDAVNAAILDALVKRGSRRNLGNRNAFAIILYPTVSIMRQFQQEWRKRSLTLGFDVVILDNHYTCIKDHLTRYGCDIVVSTPSQFYKALTIDRDPVRDRLTRGVKFIYLHHHHKNCFYDNKTKLEYCFTQVPITANGTVRIGFTERITEIVENMSLSPGLAYSRSNPRAVAKVNQSWKPRPVNCPPMFEKGWNMFFIGENPDLRIEKMQETIIHGGPIQTTIKTIVERIKEGWRKRWVVFLMPNTHNSEAIKQLTEALECNFGKRKVTQTTSENDILRNQSFWDPFMRRDPVTILMGPYFLLDCPEIQALDGVILFSPPIHTADRVRISKLTVPGNKESKPVITVRKLY